MNWFPVIIAIAIIVVYVALTIFCANNWYRTTKKEFDEEMNEKTAVITSQFIYIEDLEETINQLRSSFNNKKLNNGKASS